jgi:hypothetical protein
MITRGPWQIAFVVYESPDSIKPFYDKVWSLPLLDFTVRIEPTDLDALQLILRQQFELKLTGLPFNTTQRDLLTFLDIIKAKSCFIPRDLQYRNRPYAYINFDNQEDYDAALNSHHKFKSNVLFWVNPTAPHCRRCGNPDHEAKDCSPQRPSNPYRQLYDRFKPASYRPPRKYNNRPNPSTNNDRSVHKPNKSYAETLKSPIHNNHQSPIISADTASALKDILGRLDDLDNKLTKLNDDIITAKNEILILQDNQDDIDYRLTTLEKHNNIIHTKGGYNDEMEADELTDTPTDPASNQTPHMTSSNSPPLEKVNNLQKEFTETRSEIKSIASTINKILQTFPPSSQ